VEDEVGDDLDLGLFQLPTTLSRSVAASLAGSSPFHVDGRRFRSGFRILKLPS
jgi:hypothetical protein